MTGTTFERPSDRPLDPVELAVELMRIDSTSGREGDVVAFAEQLLARRGWTVTRIPVSPGRDDILATTGDALAVTFSTHLDTVPPFIPPRVDESHLWGRGACDAKGIAAAMVCAAERLRARGEAVGLLFVVGEEVSHDGAHAANQRAWPSRVLIDGEPTQSTLALGTKGAVRATVATRGVAAHSAYPHLGRSAIDALVAMLGELHTLELPSDPVLGETTINVGMIAGGVADNIVAPTAEARIMVRLVTPVDEVLAILRRWAAGRAELSVGVTVPPVRLRSVPGFPTSVVAFATDIPELSRWGSPYLFGPGSVHVAHRDDEQVELAELRAAVDAYERLAVAAIAADAGAATAR